MGDPILVGMNFNQYFFKGTDTIGSAKETPRIGHRREVGR